MAISTASPTDYGMSTQAHAHAFVIALDAHLIKVGLTRATTGADYNLAGSSSQMPTTVLTTSDWLAYNFTDAANATYPITIWFRIAYGYVSTSHVSMLRYVVQYRISEGHTGTTALGSEFRAYFGVDTPGTSTNTGTITYNNGVGDFVRYSGDALTVIIGGGAIIGNYNGNRQSIVELHIERCYDAVTGVVAGGFTGWTPLVGAAVATPAIWTSAYGATAYLGSTSPSVRLNQFMVSGLPNPLIVEDTHLRSLTPRMLVFSGAALAAPVIVFDARLAPTPAKKLFTVPLASFAQGTVANMDFTGVDHPYLIYRPYGGTLSVSVLAFAIEWER